jgi:hypothetical protein
LLCISEFHFNNNVFSFTFGMICRQVIEHAVLLNLPFLQGDQESDILRILYSLQFEFDPILQLSVGKELFMSSRTHIHTHTKEKSPYLICFIIL